jgi:hypothetical protein
MKFNLIGKEPQLIPIRAKVGARSKQRRKMGRFGFWFLEVTRGLIELLIFHLKFPERYSTLQKAEGGVERYLYYRCCITNIE